MNAASGQNQGLLLIRLSQTQQFALPTLKIREIVPFTPLTALPHPRPNVLGMATLRGQTISIVDMAAAVGFRPISREEQNDCSIIITEFSRQVVGFLIRGVDGIKSCDWQTIDPPPTTLGQKTYICGVTRIDEHLVQLVDTELLLEQVFPTPPQEDLPKLPEQQRRQLEKAQILLVDDSALARRQLSEVLDSYDISYQVTTNGNDAFDLMKEAADASKPITVLVSDIEMPGIDGYELAFNVRDNPGLAGAYIILHTSLSSEISVDRAKQIGADEALTKFDAKELLEAILRGAEKVN